MTLEGAGHDVVWTGSWEADPGDEEILAHAVREGRVLVTLDKDFGAGYRYDVIVEKAAVTKE